MDADQNVILLDTGARMWDAAGSTLADHIRMDERTGDFTAEGNVNSSRLPDKDDKPPNGKDAAGKDPSGKDPSGKDQKKSTDLLSGDDPLQATARKMESHDRNR